MSRSRVTIRDVAASAGVSHQTVSRVLNDDPKVMPDTRARVEAAIESLQYRPNAIARFMALGNSQTLACIAPNLTDYTFASFIEGAEMEARQHAYFLISASARDETAFADLVEQLISNRRTEGLIVINPYADQRSTLIPVDAPAVFYGARPRTATVDAVNNDDEGASRILMQHLLGLGHRQIAHLTGPLVEDCAQERLSGYQAVLREASITTDPRLCRNGDWSATSGYEIMQDWLAQGIEFSALYAQNDRMAVGAIRALHEAGRDVPQDVSVIGFDDMPLTSYFDPPLTTMRQDIPLMGREAVRLLIRRLETPDVPCEHLRFSSQLVVRNSTMHLKARSCAAV